MGRVTHSTQQTTGQAFGFGYAYNLTGALTSEIYHSGRTVAIGYDAANRATTLNGTLNGVQTPYIAQAGYWPHGAIYYITRGNNVEYAAGYNNRLQPTETYESLNEANTVSNMLFISCLNWGVSPNFGSYLYGVCGSPVTGTNDNGNLQSVTFSNGGAEYSQYQSFTQTFGYDGVNWLTSATDTGGWSRTFQYDTWGNMWVTAASGVPVSGNTPTGSTAYNTNNQITYDCVK